MSEAMTMGQWGELMDDLDVLLRSMDTDTMLALRAKDFPEYDSQRVELWFSFDKKWRARGLNTLGLVSWHISEPNRRYTDGAKHLRNQVVTETVRRWLREVTDDE